MTPTPNASDSDTTADAASKDALFQQLAQLSDSMIAAHGKDFAMGALVLAARFIAEGDARAKAANSATNTAAADTAAEAATAPAAKPVAA